MDLKTFASAVLEIAEERGIPQKTVFAVIEEALASAYKKEYGRKKQKIEARLDQKTGALEFWQVKQVLTDDMVLSEETPEKESTDKIRFNPDRHIMLDEAKKIEPNVKAEEDLKTPLEAKADFGRIAAQTAKQVILQKIKEAEKEETFKEFKEKEGEVVSGIVQRIEPTVAFMDIGRTSGILPQKEQIKNEHLKQGQRLKLYVLETEQGMKGPQVILSRAYPKLVSKLFELEVPEISAGQVVIKSIAREAGSRSKVAVQATEEGIDPIGSMVGQRGTRILAVTNELNGEKIDVIEWSEKSEEFIANALSPAKVLEVKIMPKNKAQALILDEQISLAIGKNGQNVRLAAKLTGWKIDVRSVEQAEKELAEKKAGKDASAPKGAAASKKETKKKTPAKAAKKQPEKK